MARFIKKPVAIEAFPLPAENESAQSFLNWAKSVGFAEYTSERDGMMNIETLEGVMTAMPGDFIIKGVNGEFYPCKPDIFKKTYYTEQEYAEL